MVEILVVLSLFDGISCGMVALERAGIKVKEYYASEIENTAIKTLILRMGNHLAWVSHE